jgi:hypothetical protein
MSAGSGQPPPVVGVAQIWRSVCTPDGSAEYDFRVRAEEKLRDRRGESAGFHNAYFLVFFANCEDFCRADVR